MNTIDNFVHASRNYENFNVAHIFACGSLENGAMEEAVRTEELVSESNQDTGPKIY